MSMEELPFNSYDRTRHWRAAECRCFKSREGSISVAGRRLRQLSGGSVATAERHGLLVGEGATEIVDQCRDFFENLQRKVTDAIL